MSTPNRQFFPWSRRGLSARLARRTGNQNAWDNLPTRASLELGVTLDINPGGDNSRSEAVDGPDVALFGPGDVTGIDARMISKTVPERGTVNFKPNNLVTLEFSDPDLPWIFTPAGADAQHRLQPWCTLIVVQDRPEAKLTPSEAGQMVLSLTAGDGFVLSGPGGELPDPREAWAWAHVQVTGELIDGSLETTLERAPNRVLSRVMSARQLAPRTGYIAALVPLFEAGRRAGLGEDPDAEGTATYAWPHDSALPALRLPVYHTWRFRTGEEGDFEALARLLEPKPVPAEVGTRPIDAQTPGLVSETEPAIIRAPEVRATGAPGDTPFPIRLARDPATFRLGSALRAPTAPSNPDPSAGTDTLLPLLNATSQDGQPVKAPPAYGKYHAGLDQVPAAAVPPAPWVNQLNRSMATRTVAGAGAEVIRRQQENLMAAIWDQAEGIREINQTLTRAELSRQAMTAVYTRHLNVPQGACQQQGNPTDPSLYARTGAVLGRISLGPNHSNETAATQLERAGVPRAARTAALRRLLRKPSLQRAKTGRADLTGALVGRTKFPPPLPPGPRGSISDIKGLFEVEDPIGISPAEQEAAEKAADDLVAQADPFARPAADPTENPAWADINAALCAALDPEASVPARIHDMLSPAATALIPDDPATTNSLRPLLTAPRINRPMYLDLKALGADWLCSGLDVVTANSVTLLETNNTFIESYMAGLNHEMGAEMLWRGFPTDRRGTVFRRFWDVAGSGGEPTDQMGPMHDWRSSLGNNMSGGGTEGQLVLLIRGDLLRFYPNTIIYALPAKIENGSFAPDFDGTLKLPQFRGSLDPDVVFLGFDLTEAQARAGNGWFFLIENQPTEPGFALDETLSYARGAVARDYVNGGFASWDNIAWGDMIPEIDAPAETYAQLQKAALAQISHAPVLNPPPGLAGARINNVTWGRNGAHQAFITLQRDVRVAFHSHSLLAEIRP